MKQLLFDITCITFLCLLVCFLRLICIFVCFMCFVHLNWRVNQNECLKIAGVSFRIEGRTFVVFYGSFL
jgi:hypothetical protein